MSLYNKSEKNSSDKRTYDKPVGGHYEGGHGGYNNNRRSNKDVIEDRIYVGGLPDWMSEQALFEFFSHFGKVEEAIIRGSNRYQGGVGYESVANIYGFITFSPSSSHIVKKLIRDTDPSELVLEDGTQLRVRPAVHQKRNNYGGWGNHHYQDHNRRTNNNWHKRDNRNDKGESANFNETDDKTEESQGGQSVPTEEQTPEDLHQVETGHVAWDGSMPVDLTQPQFIMPQMPVNNGCYDYPGQIYTNPMPGPNAMYPCPQLVPQAGPGYYDYSYNDQIMFIPPTAPYYNTQNPMFWPPMPVIYPPYYPAPSYQPPVEYSMPQYQVDPMSDSGFHDLTGASSMLADGSMMHDASANASVHQNNNNSNNKELEVAASPVLNLSQVFNSPHPDLALAQKMQLQHEVDGGLKNLGSQAYDLSRTRSFHPPNKQFTNFIGGNHLEREPQGNRAYPFGKGGAGHVRRFSTGDKYPKNERNVSIIKKPLKETEEVAKKDGVGKRLSTNQPDLLQDSLHHMNIK